MLCWLSDAKWKSPWSSGNPFFVMMTQRVFISENVHRFEFDDNWLLLNMKWISMTYRLQYHLTCTNYKQSQVNTRDDLQQNVLFTSGPYSPLPNIGYIANHIFSESLWSDEQDDMLFNLIGVSWFLDPYINRPFWIRNGSHASEKMATTRFW